MLNDSFVQHPPADLMVASYLGYTAPESKGKIGMIHASKNNKEAMRAIPQVVKGKLKNIDQMPTFIRNNDMLGVISKLQQDMRGE